MEMLSTLLRELQHKQDLEENRARQASLASALRQEALEREWARAEGSATRVEMNKLEESIEHITEMAISAEAERRVLLQDLEELEESSAANIEEVLASPVFVQLEQAEQELDELKTAPTKDQKELEELTEKVRLSSDHAQCCEANAQAALDALQREQQARQAQVHQFNNLITADNRQGIGRARPKRASRFD
eukprot:TRINITY_DN50208_c0_g1_i1.p1 TRINITY_DN50208_c0_g1~~TRINITY_DN50208_c0_g1_i1.p1  ORF type:complete len:191 (+),score=57.91 TRINITY_DN50208_c0_g1_i1:450-1022(+)